MTSKKIRTIRLSDEEHERLQANAKTMGVSMSELIRRTAIYGHKMSPVILDMEPIRKILFEFQKQGNNLNQLAKQANRFGISEGLEDEIRDELQNVKNLLGRTDELITDIREGRLNL